MRAADHLHNWYQPGQLMPGYLRINLPAAHSFSASWTWESPTGWSDTFTLEVPCLVLFVLHVVWWFSSAGGDMRRRAAARIYLDSTYTNICGTYDVLTNTNSAVESYNTRCVTEYVVLEPGIYNPQGQVMCDSTTTNFKLVTGSQGADTHFEVIPFRLP